MNSSTKGFILLVTSFLIVFGVAGSADNIPADAGYFHWAGVGLALVVAFISGLLGYSYVNESNGQ
jgi:hypothetical protein